MSNSVLGADAFELKSSRQIKLIEKSPFGHNGVINSDWKESNFIDLLSKHPDQLIRIPGGTVANYWSWEKGGFVDGDISVERIALKERDILVEIGDYVDAIKQSSATPIFVLNLLTSNLQMQIDSLTEFERNGIEIRFIELGNEFYQSIPDVLTKFPSVDSYLDQVEVYVQALRKRFPEAQIAVVGNARERGYTRASKWNSTLARRKLSGADAVTMHVYGVNLQHEIPQSRAGVPFNRPDQTTSDGFMFWMCDFLFDNKCSKKEMPVGDNLVFPNEDELLKNLIQKPSTVVAVWNNFFMKDFPKNTPVWVTESGILWRERYDDLSGLWVHGLQNSILTFNLMHIDNIKFVVQHAIAGNNNFGYAFSGQRSFQTKTNKSFATEKYGLSAKGFQTDLIQKFLKGAESIERLELFVSDEIVVGEDVFVSLANKLSSQSLLIINANKESKKIILPDQSSFKFGESISSDPFRRVHSKKDLVHETLGDVGSSITLVPFSVTVLHSE